MIIFFFLLSSLHKRNTRFIRAANACSTIPAHDLIWNLYAKDKVRKENCNSVRIAKLSIVQYSSLFSHDQTVALFFLLFSQQSRLDRGRPAQWRSLVNEFLVR